MTPEDTADILRDHEAMAEALDATGRYRVLRRLERRSKLLADDGSPTRLGLFVDTETTGLNSAGDEIIELAMVRFEYALDGRIFRIGESFEKLRQPARPIPAAVTALTGIDDAMVAGRSIDPAEVESFVEPADLIVAHNSGFDRRFLERFSAVFARKPWGCSMSQIDWANEGFEGTKLAYLAMGAGFFYERHRASADCLAAIELLASKLPRSGRTGMSLLLQAARRPGWRIWAEKSPFSAKDRLKGRGYRWNGDGGTGPRAWYVDLDGEETVERELSYLREQVYGHEIELPVRRITPCERFSDRI